MCFVKDEDPTIEIIQAQRRTSCFAQNCLIWSNDDVCALDQIPGGKVAADFGALASLLELLDVMMLLS